MGNPIPISPVPEVDKPNRFYNEGGLDSGAACVAPPEFNLEASGSEQDFSGPSYHGGPACVEGESDPILDAINLAHANTSSKWAQGRLLELEGILPAVRNILQGAGVSYPAEGSIHHHSAYASWNIPSGQKKGLVSLYKAIHESSTPKEQGKHLRSAEKAFGKSLRQVRAFAKDKKFRDLPGFKELKAAVDAGITVKIDGMKEVVAAATPSRVRRSSGGGGGSSKGFNREKITDQTLLPGLAAPTKEAPAEGTMEASVEAAMQRDLVVNSGSVEDFLYVNIPDIVSGTGKSEKAKSMWLTIKRYRDKHLTSVYGEHVKNPADPIAKKAYEDALAKMEAEIGPEIRATAKSLWQKDSGAVDELQKEGGGLYDDAKAQRESMAEASAAEGFDPETLDGPALAESVKALQKRLIAISGKAKEIGLPKSSLSVINNNVYTGRKKLGEAASILGSKRKLTSSRYGKALEACQAAEDGMKKIADHLVEAASAITAHNAKVQHIADHLGDPAKVPLVKPVKRHGVTVTFKGYGEGQDVTASYGTKPESTIGIYEDVWSPRSISDAQGTFSRPKGAERGKKVYEELKAKYGFTESEAKILGSVSTGEGDYHSVNSVDVMRVSLGFIQFAGASFTALLQSLKADNPTFFKEHFEQYGILIDDGKSKMPAIAKRNERHIPGAEHNVSEADKKSGTYNKEEQNRTNNKLVVYDHQAREWVNGLEAMAVLQSDPRYLTLIQSSVKNPSMEFAQIKRAKDKYHNATRNGRVTYKEAGLEIPDGDKKAFFRVKDVFKNELCAYGVTAWGIGAGPGMGIGLAKRVIKAIVKEKGVKTLAELQAVPQSEMTVIFKKHYKKWGRPTKFGEAIGSPLSDSFYDGVH